MRVLWITNVKLPIISRMQDGNNKVNIGGWLDRISQGLLQNKSIELVVCYPCGKSEKGAINNLSYYGIPYDGKKMRLGCLDDESGVHEAERILSEVKPDIIHIHGTEFQYHWFFAQAAKNLGIEDKLLVSIQGLVSVYAKHYALNLPTSVKYAVTIREMVGRKNIYAGIKNFEKRGLYEEKTIKLTPNIMGRTSWDKACTYRLNSEAEYYVGNETLRESFYSGEWKAENCVQQRIFISQASYPVKGFHLFIEALRDIVSFYPNVSVHVAGVDITKETGVFGNSYGIYISKQLKKYNLTNVVHFCGSLNETQMKQEMLEANVFVSPSTIENSPNSVGEAMLLGVPIVSSNVGGVADLLKDKEEGYLYQSDAPYMLAYYVMQTFKDLERASIMGQNARKHAAITHSYENNLKCLLDVYHQISKK